MLGPAVRTERLLTELRDEGVDISEADRARIRGPAGLDLGAEGAEEIAGRDRRRDRGREAGPRRGLPEGTPWADPRAARRR
jgi:hypothetical protein